MYKRQGLVCLDGKMSFSFLGEGFTLICGIFYALQIVAVEKWCSDLYVILHTIIQFFTAFFICFIFFILSESFPKHISTGSVLALVYVTVFVTALCFVFMNMGIKHTTASSSSLIPVSYTHLDVYKRQALGRYGQKCKLRRENI